MVRLCQLCVGRSYSCRAPLSYRMSAMSLVSGRTKSCALLACALTFAGCNGAFSINLPGALPGPTQPGPSPASEPTATAPFGGCHLDANCPEHNEWQTEMGSIVDIRATDDPDQHGCTGVLLNNASGDGTPYVLVGRHCRNGREDNTGEQLTWWKFYFGRKSSRCGADVTSRVPPCRLENGCIQGGQVVATGTNGGGEYSLSRDYMLVRLSRSIPSSFNATFAGWSIEDSIPQSMTVIGHPTGMPMTIAYDHDSADYSDNCDRNGMMWRLFVDDGQVILGHSGSPVFDEDHRVRGSILTGASCTRNTRSCASALKYNWTYGPTGSRLIDHLAGGDRRLTSVSAR